MFCYASNIEAPDRPFRQCAAILLLESTSSQRFLLVHKPRKQDAWQLPQGGIDKNESSIDAANRELLEEVNGHMQQVSIANTLYEYVYTQAYASSFKGQYCGQQLIFHLGICANPTELQVDNVEIDDYCWVTIDQLPQYIERPEYFMVLQHIWEEAKGLYAHLV